MVLVTGAGGHVGTNLIRRLVARGDEVRAVLLPGESTPGLEDLNIEFFVGNVCSPDDMRNAVAGVDVVYHLAGVIGVRKGSDALMRRVNVEGTRTVALAAREAGVRRFVYVSSIHAIERPDEGLPIHEGLAFDPHNPAGEYDRTKAAASLEILRLVKAGLPAVIVCPTGIIGPNDYKNSEMGRAITGWMQDKRHWMIDGHFDFVDVRDIADGLIAACERGRVGETYILNGTHISLKRLRDTVSANSGGSRKARMISWRFIRAISKFTEPVFSWFGRTSPFTSYSIETVRSNSEIKTDKARAELGYSSRPIDDTLRDTVNWLRTRQSRGTGRTAMVTGASSGIGSAVARELAASGYKVLLVARNAALLERVADEIRGDGGEAIVHPCDLTDPEQLDDLLREATRSNRSIDILVNNAGNGWYGYFHEMRHDTAIHMLHLNNEALVTLTQGLLPGMVERGFGRVLNMGSIAGLISAQGTVLYSATKAFIDSFTRALGRELSGSGVTATVVRPGPVMTDFFRNGQKTSRYARVPAESLGISATSVARRVVSLVSRPRRIAYVPRILGVLPVALLFLRLFLDLAGPLHLKRADLRG